MNLIEAARGLIALESTPESGNAAAAALAANLCRDAGLVVEEQREFHHGLEQINVIARPRAEAPGEEILFQAHLDTPPAGHFGHWTKTQCDPFNATIYGDELFGLGAANAKLDFLAKLEAIRSVAKLDLKCPPVLVGSFGAMSGMAGAIKLMRRKKINARMAIVGAPTQNRLVTSGFGSVDFEVLIPYSEEEARYRRAHDALESSSTQSRVFSGPPFAGQNAIHTMLDHLAQLPGGVVIMDLHGGVEGGGLPAGAILEIDLVQTLDDPVRPKIVRVRDEMMALERALNSRGTVQLVTVRASANEVKLNGRCRLEPSFAETDLLRELGYVAQALNAVNATLRVKDYRPGFTTEPAGALVRTAREVLRDVGGDANVNAPSSESEANVFHRLGLECLVFGPGRAGADSAANEFVSLREVTSATDFYRALIERFCV